MEPGTPQRVTDADIARSRAQLTSLSLELKEHLTLVMSRSKEIVTSLASAEKLLKEHLEPSGPNNGNTAPNLPQTSAPVKIDRPQATTIERPDLEIKIQLRTSESEEGPSVADNSSS